jgi:hypothetical protein
VAQTTIAETRQKKCKFLGSDLFTAATKREDREGSGGMFQFSLLSLSLSIARHYLSFIARPAHAPVITEETPQCTGLTG